MLITNFILLKLSWEIMSDLVLMLIIRCASKQMVQMPYEVESNSLSAHDFQ